MDVYQVYLNTLRYVMNSDPDDKATWNDIFKYLPCLHQMLLCCVCGNLLHRPQGPVNSVCLHHVCHGCVGGKMRLKPSCSWCKDYNHFTENKKLRVLVLCFKRLCAYISHSKLGQEISKLSTDGPGKDPELTRLILIKAEEFIDDFPFTAPPLDLPKSLKSVQGHNRSKVHSLALITSQPSTSGIDVNSKPYSSSSDDLKGGVVNGQASSGRGRRKKNLSKLPLKKSPQSNTSIHIKRLKRKALSTRNNTSPKKFQLKKLPNSGRFMKRNSPPVSSGLLIAQRPHRELSGKFSVGQLWRETFLEERSPEPETYYPDSGIEVGNSSDQDHSSQPPTLKHQNDVEKSSSMSNSETHERVVHTRDTRLHPAPESLEKISGNAAQSMGSQNHNNKPKPRLTLTISKKQLSKVSKRGQQQKSVQVREQFNSSSLEFGDRLPNKLSNLKRKDFKFGSGRPSTRKRDICRCARFKQPNQLTCFGQKCPCYRDRKACIDCMCNGCKNPRRKADTVPALIHMVNESTCVQHGIDPSMPRLSPIPRI